jgi:hypothetical protein
MSDQPSGSSALPLATDSPPINSGAPTDHWPKRRFTVLLILFFAAHVALIFVFGTRKPILPLPSGPTPHLQLVDGANELVALSNPTLFVRPNAHDGATAFWRNLPPVSPPSFDWPELPHYLQPVPAVFGAAFHEFIQRRQPVGLPLDFKPAPTPVAPEITFESPVPSESTFELSAELAHRRLLNSLVLPSWPRNNVLAPSTVQVLVDPAGNVMSSVVLPASGMRTIGDIEVDAKALELIRQLRFAPAAQPTVGDLTFHWHTIPTNTPPAALP